MKVLVDIYLADNLGDDMFLDHLANQFPSINFTPFYPGKDYQDFFNQYPNIEAFSYSFLDKIKARLGNNKLTNYRKLAEEYDALLFLGGGIFREESYWKEVFSYRVEISRAFRAKDKGVFFIGCNFGPYKTDTFVKAHKDLFSNSNLISFRDKTSYNLFKELKNIQYAPDLLWSYPLSPIEKKENTVGISIIDPRHKQGMEHTYEEYIKVHKDLCTKYIEEGKKVKLFSFCSKEGDTEIAKAIISDINAVIPIIEYDKNIKNYLKEIGRCSYFVAARFHAVILAMKFSIPVIPVIYGDKTENLLKDIDYKEEFIYLENIKSLMNSSFWEMNQELKENYFIESNKHLSFLKK